MDEVGNIDGYGGYMRLILVAFVLKFDQRELCRGLALTCLWAHSALNAVRIVHSLSARNQQNLLNTYVPRVSLSHMPWEMLDH